MKGNNQHVSLLSVISFQNLSLPSQLISQKWLTGIFLWAHFLNHKLTQKVKRSLPQANFYGCKEIEKVNILLPNNNFWYHATMVRGTKEWGKSRTFIYDNMKVLSQATECWRLYLYREVRLATAAESIKASCFSHRTFPATAVTALTSPVFLEVVENESPTSTAPLPSNKTNPDLPWLVHFGTAEFNAAWATERSEGGNTDRLCYSIMHIVSYSIIVILQMTQDNIICSCCRGIIERIGKSAVNSNLLIQVSIAHW